MLKNLANVDFKGGNPSETNDLLLYTDYLSQIKDHEETIIDPSMAFKFQGNFYGLLRELRVPGTYFIATLYLNNLTNPLDYKGKAGGIKIAKQLPIPKH